MKKLLLLCSLALGMGYMQGQTLSQSMYVDFGPTGGTNGGVTPGPDANGNYWNNATNGALNAAYDIVNANNADTGIDMTVTDNFVVNTTTNYGPTTITAAALGDLAISTATMDYFYLESGGSANSTGQLTFTNLNPQKGYKFYIFGSRPTTNVRISSYTLNGLNSFTGQLQTSDGGTGNLANILGSTMLSPDASGKITLSVGIVQNAFAYINALRIEEYSNMPVVDVTSIAVTGADISISGQASQMSAVVSPSNATFQNVVWSTSDAAVAVISTTGLLRPVGNGTVTVTAASAQNPGITGTATITVSNQVTHLYFSGSATENGDAPATALPMHMVTGTNGVVSNTFEIYTSLLDNGTFNFYTTQDGSGAVYGLGTSAGTLTLNGPAIDPTQTGTVLITVNLTANTYTITPINWSITGSSIANGWSGDAPLTYQGGGIWSNTIDMTVVGTDVNPRFVFKANQSWSYVMKKVTGSVDSVIMESQANEYGITMNDIDLKYGNFVITLNLNNYTYGIACVGIDDHKISFMGSSVMNGQGATNMLGYAYKYNELLQQRATAGSPAFYRSNISVNGNNTTAALSRFEKDLEGDCGTYVIFGLALGNEGIHEAGQTAYDSYNTNLQLLIQKAIAEGKTPLVMNNYVRADYNATDYNFVKQMNLLMAQWNVPSINTLGATDNGTGNWVDGYWFDALHPNDAGHTEMFYVMVPSLFDAIESGKTQPATGATTGVAADPTAAASILKFTPDNVIHPFTTAVDFKTTASGQIMGFTTTTTAEGSVAVSADGTLVYTSPAGATIATTAVVADGNWHTVALTHYYAWGKTLLYVDGIVAGSINEQLEAKIFSLHGSAAPADATYRNWYFYRSGMNDLEIAALYNGTMLKSSLELYAPLNGEAETADAMFANLAQSTVAIDAANFMVLSTNAIVAGNNKMTAYPNPVSDVLNIKVAKNQPVTGIQVYNTLGMLVKDTTNTASVNLAGLQAGVYVVKVQAGNASGMLKIVKR